MSFDCIDDFGRPQDWNLPLNLKIYEAQLSVLKKLCHAAHIKSQKCTRNAELTALAPKYRRQKSDFYEKCFEKFSSYAEYENSAHDLCAAIDQLNVWRRQYQVPEFGVPSKDLCDIAQAWSQTMAKDMKLKHSPQYARNNQGLL